MGMQTCIVVMILTASDMLVILNTFANMQTCFVVMILTASDMLVISNTFVELLGEWS